MSILNLIYYLGILQINIYFISKDELSSIYIVALYNESVEYATLAIDSLCNQTYTELEIILLLDNPQNKRLLSLLKEYTQRDNRIVLYINEKNMGLPTTLNFGISVAHGEFIARMDGDDISMPQRIENN